MIGKFFSWKSRTENDRTARLPDGLRVYAIGDIHGCVHLLDRLHGEIEADLARSRPAEVQLVYLGDYVDRGPDSAGVLDRLARPPSAGFRRVLLKGNHEEMLGNFLTDSTVGASWRQLGGLETLLSYRIDVNAVLARAGFDGLAEEFRKRVPPEHTAMLAGLQRCVTFGDYYFCHAGVRP